MQKAELRVIDDPCTEQFFLFSVRGCADQLQQRLAAIDEAALRASKDNRPARIDLEKIALLSIARWRPFPLAGHLLQHRVSFG